MFKEKILIFGINRFNNPTGICKYASSFAEMLVSNDSYSVSIVLGSWQVNYFREKFKLDSNISVIVLNIPNNSIARNLWFLFSMPFLIKRWKPNKIIFSYPIPFIKKLIGNNITIYSVIHDLYPFTNSNNFKFPFFNRAFTKINVNNSDKLFVVSKQTNIEFIKIFPDRSKDVILQYIPLRFTFERFESPITNSYFLCVAQHSKNKNINLVIDAYVKFISIYDLNFDLVIIGSRGSETELLNQMVNDYNIVERVHFLNNLNQNLLVSYYQNCEVFLLFSSNEGLGIPLVEALFYSKYIICSDIPVFKEIEQFNVNFIKNYNEDINTILSKSLINLKPNLKRFHIDGRFDFKNSTKLLKL